MDPYYGYPYPWDYEQYIRTQQIRQMRHGYSVQGWAVLIYAVIMYAAVFLVMFIDSILKSMRSMAMTGAVDEQWVEDSVLQNTGWGYLLAIVIGFMVLLLWKKPQFTFDTIWKRNQPMKVGGFFRILSLFMSTQTVFILLAILMEILLNQIGMTSVANEALDYGGLSMFLYIGIGAPISEELLFRGLVLRSMEPYGKKFAIFASALLFGLFHGNLSQAPHAFCVGLVLGYVTLEHNIAWAMVLHMFNNLIISDVSGRLSQLLPGGVVEVALVILLFGFTIAAVATLISKRAEIRSYLEENLNFPGCAKAFWSAPGIIVLLIFLGISIVLSLMDSVVPL